MPFSSTGFLLFAAAAAFGFRLAPRAWRARYLLIVSYLYCFTWSPAHALILLAATAVAYRTGLRLANGAAPDAERRLAAGIVLLLGALAFFKLFNPVGAALAGPGAPRLLIPIGISYYTFKLIGYMIDVHWGQIPPEEDFAAFGAYAAFFPQIFSGPIQRPADFLSQLAAPEKPGTALAAAGVRRIVFGLFQKIVVADRLAEVVDAVYAAPASFHGVQTLIGLLAFSFQLYADFSGVTDIAIGVGLLFGIRAPENFALPYYSPNIQEFWRRWHMSLTSWLSDYLFIPLRMAFRRRGDAGIAASVFLTMFAVGLWHGARWNCVIFGTLNGVFVAVSALTLARRNRVFSKLPALGRSRVIVGTLLTFALTSLTQVFFRADTPSVAWSVLRGAASAGPWRSGFGLAWTAVDWVLLGAALLLMEAVHLAGDAESAGGVQAFLGYAAMLFFLLVTGGSSTPFIYSRF
ncbi:MAG: MBOAT family O-acyltransferase [Elusimicrobiota bacterium]